MKTTFKIYSIVILSIFALISCSKDNYDEPTSFIKGRVVYKGEALNYVATKQSNCSYTNVAIKNMIL